MRLSLPRIMVVVLALAAPAFAEPLDFPSDGLESRIEFWKKVYTQYGERDVIIHDRIHVNIIYDVASDDDVRSRIANVQSALKEIRDNLDTPENLSPIAIQVRDSILSNSVTLSPAVLDELQDNVHTQRGIKERFRDGVIRSGRYIDAFREIFAKEGVPVEVALLPLVESSFENRSLSKVGAAGIWQFTRGTGRQYMKVTRKLDERLDPSKATVAAARLLRGNYDALGSWPVAITAYNHGRAGMARAQETVGTNILTIIKDYRGPLFGYASMNFYTEFLAAVDVYRNYEQYYGQLVLDTPTMKSAAAKASASKIAARPRVQVAKASPATRYTVRKGDTLWDIAQKFGLTIGDLMDKNNLRNSAIHAGQLLLVK
jgi:peptidoglycan lytic transglycosylase D